MTRPRGLFGGLFRRSPSAVLADAERAIEGGDAPAGAALLRPMAEAGAAAAQFRLGELYEQAKGVIHSHVDAVRWFRAAAEQGHVGAQAKLGEDYFSGRGAPASVTAAAAALQEEVETGGTREAGGGLIGRLFPGGLTVRQDVAEAA